MGNLIALERHPLHLQDVLDNNLDSGTVDTPDPAYSSCLFLWSFYSGKDSGAVENSSVVFSAKNTITLDNQNCYLLLHVYHSVSRTESWAASDRPGKALVYLFAQLITLHLEYLIVYDLAIFKCMPWINAFYLVICLALILLICFFFFFNVLS